MFIPSEDETYSMSDFISPQDNVFEFCKSPRTVAEIAEMLGENDRRWIRRRTALLGTEKYVLQL